jgi:hypothetical protein
MEGQGFRVSGFGFRISDFVFRFSVSGFRVQGSPACAGLGRKALPKPLPVLPQRNLFHGVGLRSQGSPNGINGLVLRTTQGSGLVLPQRAQGLVLPKRNLFHDVGLRVLWCGAQG